jgi:hypothetical protein
MSTIGMHNGGKITVFVRVVEIAEKYPTQKTARGNLKIMNLEDLILWTGPGKPSN